MIYSIGCDLCAIPRMEKKPDRAPWRGLARRVFGPDEREALGLSEQAESLPARRIASAAANFAAKEAFLKAAGTGWPSLCPGRDPGRAAALGGAGLPVSGRTAQWVAQRRPDPPI